MRFPIDTFDIKLAALLIFPKALFNFYTSIYTFLWISFSWTFCTIENTITTPYSMFLNNCDELYFIANNVINIYGGFAFDSWISHIISNSSVECLHSWMDKRNWTRMLLFLKRLMVQRALTSFVGSILHYVYNIIYISNE